MMSTVATMDEGVNDNTEIDNPGIQLASLREQRGFSVEYVASKLHLRMHVIEMLESGDFHLLPEAVFIKGYLRAYAKLLGVSADPFINVYNKHFDNTKKSEKITLWQSKKESHKAEHYIRWFTLLFAFGVLVSVGIWWQKNREIPQITQINPVTETASTDVESVTTEIKLTDISNMQSLLSPDVEAKSEMTPLETHGG